MSIAAGETTALRPLSIGEIFDRAVTLCVRHFVLFALITLAVLLPIELLSLAFTLNSGAFQSMLQQATNPKNPLPAASLGPILQIEGVAFMVLLLRLTLMPFAAIATAGGVGELYAGERPTVMSAYRPALRKWGGILLAEFFEGVIVGALAIAGGVVFSVGIAVGVFVMRGSGAGLVALFIVFAAGALAYIVIAALCVFAVGFAFNAIALERAELFAALSAGFERIFNRREFWRACLFALAVGAIYIGILLVSGALAAFGMTYAHSLLLLSLVSIPVNVVMQTFLAVLFAVYYFDVRVRREGLDLQMTIERMDPAPGP